METTWEVDYGDLKLEKAIGRGNFGIVWKGLFEGKVVAVKEILPSSIESAEFDMDAKAQEREIEMLSQVDHPNVIGFYGAATIFDKLYLVFEYMSGGDLSLITHDPKLPWPCRFSIARDAAAALEHLHQRNMIHRDVKSENFLLDQSGRVRLCDFGFTRPSELKESRMTMCGTEFTMAPEMMLGMDYDNSVDVFSYGIVVIELITGTPGASIERVIPGFGIDEDVVRDTALPDCPEEFFMACLDCVNDDPEDRPRMMDVVGFLDQTMQKLFDIVPGAGASFETFGYTGKRDMTGVTKVIVEEDTETGVQDDDEEDEATPADEGTVTQSTLADEASDTVDAEVPTLRDNTSTRSTLIKRESIAKEIWVSSDGALVAPPTEPSAPTVVIDTAPSSPDKESVDDTEFQETVSDSGHIVRSPRSRPSSQIEQARKSRPVSKPPPRAPSRPKSSVVSSVVETIKPETEEKATDDASGESNDSDTDGEEVPETASDDGQESPKTTVSSTAAADDDAAAQAKGGSKRIPIADRVVHEPAKNAPKIIQVAAPPQMAVEVDYVDLTSAIVDARIPEGITLTRQVCKGYLFKEGGAKRKMFQRLRWRWFVVNVGAGTIKYFVDHTERECKGSIDLKHVNGSTPSKIVQQKDLHAFELMTRDRTYMLKATNKQIMRMWIAAFNVAVGIMPSKKPSAPAILDEF